MSVSLTQSPAPDVSDSWASAVDVPQQIIAAWADHNAEAFANVFTENGTMILPGQFATGRSAIKEFMERAFAGPYKGTQVHGTPFQVRQINEDTVLLLTEGGVSKPGADHVAAEDAVRASWLLVRDGDAWKLAAYQNSPRS